MPFPVVTARDTSKYRRQIEFLNRRTFELRTITYWKKSITNQDVNFTIETDNDSWIMDWYKIFKREKEREKICSSFIVNKNYDVI